ncbi:MAG TPA: hypothetical protein VHL79_10370, partial [Ramlibacter sp.]|nr:hypothetical protein [Ramlibacter sp.]
PDQAEPIRNQLRTAMRALNAQNDAMFAAAEGAGLKIDAPATGWLRVGLFSESGQEVKLSDRMDRAGLKYDGRKQLTAVKLKFDAQVIADGDNCASIKIEDAKPIAAPAPGAKTLVMRADELPIEVLDVAECTMRSGVRDRYVRVRTPATRLRYAEFKSMGA